MIYSTTKKSNSTGHLGCVREIDFTFCSIQLKPTETVVYVLTLSHMSMRKLKFYFENFINYWLHTRRTYTLENFVELSFCSLIHIHFIVLTNIFLNKIEYIQKSFSSRIFCSFCIKSNRIDLLNDIARLLTGQFECFGCNYIRLVWMGNYLWF